MKKVTILYIIGLTLASLGLLAQNGNYKVFPFKSGIIEYQLEGNSQGTHTKYIDDYGYKQADYTETITKVFGFSTKENKGIILIGPKVYSIDYKINLATVGNNPVYSMYANSDGNNYDELGKEAMTKLGFSYSGQKENILGNNCEIWEGVLGKIWIWKGLALKSKTKILGITITETATKVNIKTRVSASKFELPKGIEVEEAQMTPGMDDMFGEEEPMSSEDKKAIQKVSNMSYKDFKKMMQKENPEMSEREIKQTYQMTKQMSKFMN